MFVIYWFLSYSLVNFLSLFSAISCLTEQYLLRLFSRSFLVLGSIGIVLRCIVMCISGPHCYLLTPLQDGQMVLYYYQYLYHHQHSCACFFYHP